MSQKIRLVSGDTRPQLVFDVTDDFTGDPVDFSEDGTSALVNFREAGSDTIKVTMLCFKLNGRTDPETGEVSFDAPYDVLGRGGRLAMDWSVDALDTAGEFEAELEITFEDGGRQTCYDIAKFSIREEF